MKGMLVDVTRCTGCERCVAACVAAHGLDEVQAERDRARTRDGLSGNRLLAHSEVGTRFARTSCMHCLDPACVTACLVGGISRTPEGAVIYDADKCIGCRYCMLACPFHVPRYEWSATIPFMVKCDMCWSRQLAGEVPACVAACPHEVLEFGDRDLLLRAARRLIAQQPARYLARIWGETEFGGTAVLYVSDVDLAPLGWPAASSPSIAALTVPLIEKTPAIGLTVASCLLGVNWLIRRRMKLRADALTGEHDSTQAGHHHD